MRQVVLVFALALSCAPALHGQSTATSVALPGQSAQTGAPGMPARDRATATGTAIVKGQLLDATTGAPIRGARVSLFGGREQNTPSSQTDAEGRFELRDVPAGKYSVNAGKAGYLSLFATNGNKPVPPLEVKDSDKIEGVVLRLARGGVIAGQVFDEFGEPLAGAEVRVMRYRYNNGTRQLMPSGANGFPVATDDLGSFRVYGLEPGDYYVLARPSRNFVPQSASGPGGDGPAPTYYPGTANVAEARRIAVRPGQVVQGVAFPIAIARLARVRGRVMSGTGEPFTGSVSVHQSDLSGGFQGFGGPVRPDGTFELANIPPGNYTLIARENDFGNPAANAESGRTPITVTGEDVNDVMIMTSRGGTVRGRISTDEGIPPPFVASSFTLYAQPAEPGFPTMGRGAMTKVASNWTFEISGVFDRVHLRPSNFVPATGAPEGPWTIRAVLVDGQDVMDHGIDVRPGSAVENVEIVYTRKVSRLSGRLLDDRGQPADGWIILFPAEESLWKPQSRYLRPSRSGLDGQYRIQPPPYDDYLLIGVSGIDDGQWQDPEFLRSIRDLAIRFSIGENETKTQDVKLVDWRR